MIPRNAALKMVGNGWSALIHEAYDKLPPTTSITDVKEKYGTLRIYCDAAPMSYHDILDSIEQKSAYVCEFCSAPATTTSIGGWLKTICQDCLNKRRERWK